jgi:hypothetical protein
MAVHSFNGTLVANTVSTTTLTSWQPYVAITVAASPSGTVWVTTDGSTATVAGTDCEAVASGTTAVIRNLLPRPELTTVADTTGGTQPSNTVAFSTPATKVSLISSAACVFTAALVTVPGSATVLS